MSTPTFSLLFKIVLALSFASSYGFKDQFVNFGVEGTSWNFDRDCCKSVHQFGDYYNVNNFVFQSINIDVFLNFIGGGVCSLLRYRSTFSFCILMLYSAILLNSY